ncbi:MAG: FRG domain-containing protein [Nitrospira sp.]|nr:FRG domain-containing protein [Nitrospira sp.]
MAVRKTLDKRIGRRIYRGQRDPTWPLSSVFERSVFHLKGNDPSTDVDKALETKGGLWKTREGYWDRFYEYAHGLPGLPNAMSPEDWWILGRHHGLVTPLLDWSESPYIAAFFALTDYMEFMNPGFKLGMPTGGIKWGEGSIAIWELVEAGGMGSRNEEFQIIRPATEFSVHSLRVRAQKSVFTKLIHDVHLDLESYLGSRDLIACLERYDIPGVEAAKALRDLELMNITFSDLFPDLGGAAARANFGSSSWHLVGGML